MKDNEFIELLNLYLDHEISEADAARLEAEVQRNPARYRVYREYCQMHKACALLSPAYAAEAPAPAVAAFETRSRPWANPFVQGGLMAAAAAVAFVFFNQAPTAVPTSSEAGVVAATSATTTAETAVAATTLAPRSIGQTVTVPVLLGRADRAGATTQSLRWNTGEVTAPVVQDTRFNWIETLQLTSVSQVPADSLRFETKPASKDAQRSFGSGPIETPAAYNAFQMQR